MADIKVTMNAAEFDLLREILRQEPVLIKEAMAALQAKKNRAICAMADDLVEKIEDDLVEKIEMEWRTCSQRLLTCEGLLRRFS